MLLNTKEDWQPEEGDVIAWQRAFPSVDVHQELRAMESWCDANPTKRKTKSGIKRFVNSWLTRCQDRGGSSPMASKKETSLRSMSLLDQLTDITWVDDIIEKDAARQYFLKKYNHCYEG